MKKIIFSIFEGKAVCYLSTMIILEAYYVSLKNKDFDFANFLKIINVPNIKIIAFDGVILNKSLELPPKMDIHDRIIVATAVATNTRLVTKDKTLRSLFPLETIW